MIKIFRIHKLNTKLHLISVETQCNVSTFVHKLFKSLFKS